ncbi:MAG TPA: hypothetical protein PLN06_04040 [Bacteroidales bacterium]|nr:hypothetical protein [Bacteroidales bacterium]HOU95777.1 hypothetical protein [Bacteroidales bacterium]HQG36562.1 hypothetical protein [Bacteroidales bacterium]HQG52933.1 hypothetical protein [Bacteroidales bacterium]HQJ21025.1 hypothetical protein [Bacteroidales bacterium]
MASIKNLKKNIDKQIFEVISDCLLFLNIHPEQDAEEVSSIIHEAIALRNNLFERVNNYNKEDASGEIKKHFRSIESDLYNGIDLLCAKLSKISERREK